MTTLIGAKTDRVYSAATLLSEGTGFGLGDRYTDHAGNTWTFVQATGAITQYDTVAIKNAYLAAALTAALAKAPIEIGFAQVAFATAEYGWVMTNGRPTIRVAIDCEPSLPLYTTGTAGVLDDATTTQMIQGVVIITSATAAGAYGAVANFPKVNWGANLSQI